MNFLKKLFGGTVETPQQESANKQAKDFDTLKYDGVAALKMQALDHAVRCFTYALELQEDGETRDYLAQAYIRKGDLPEAYTQLEHLAETEPHNVRIWLLMADVAYMMENYTAMAEACEKANEIDSESVLVNYSYARACIGRHDFVNAIALLTKAINLSKEDPYWEAYLLKGQTLLKMGEVELAENNADAILAQMPDHEDALLLKARCYKFRSQYAEAQNYLGKVIEVNPFSLDAFSERAEVRRALGDIAGAEEDMLVAQEFRIDHDAENSLENTKENILQKTEEAYSRVNPFA